MALRYIDSFDHYAQANLPEKGWNLSASVGDQIGIATGRFGNALNINTAIRSAQRAFDAQATWVVGGACMFNNPGSSTPGTNVLFAFLDGTSTQCEVRYAADRKLYVTRNGTQIGAGTNALRLFVWYYIEFKVTINNSTGIAVVKVDGTNEINLSSQDTQATGNATADTFSFGSVASGGGGVWLDDLYILDGTGSSPTNDFLGDVRVEALYPSGNGNSSQLVGQDADSTNNYLNVDETAPNSDTDYNESSTVGNKDTYAYTNLTASTGTVYGVQPCMYARKTDAGVRSIASIARVSTTEVDSSNKTLSTTYQYFTDIREAKPGGGAWTVTDVNNAEFGVKVTA